MSITNVQRIPAPDALEARSGPAANAVPGWPLVPYFHHVSADVRHYTSLDPGSFAYGLDLLLARFDPVDPTALDATESSTKRRVLITFDDGYANNYHVAAPILESRGVRALFFIVSRPDNWSRQRAVSSEPFMSGRQLEGLLNRGHALGSHTRHHPDLTELSPQDAIEEIVGGMSDLEKLTGRQNLPFAFPFGRGELDLARRAEHNGLVFGTVRGEPADWRFGEQVLRTYLPTGRSDLWPDLIESWAKAVDL